MAPIEQIDRATAREPYATIRRAILLNCFGRGGSSILWNMIGSSPDVLMPNGEWHVGFYGKWLVVGRVLRRVMRRARIDTPAFGPLSSLIYRRACATVSQHERESKPGASSVVIKVMDHHIAMNSAIAAGFSDVKQVILVRNPLAQCESLMRSGQDLRTATRWYVDVTDRMIDLAKRSDNYICRFEDLVRDPFAIRDDMYAKLSIAPPLSGSFKMKRKKYGADRTPEIKKAAGHYVDVTFQNVSEIVDRDVNERSVMRLSDMEKSFILRQTGRSASFFGYNL